ncbi:MAG: hypothetical protein MZW92_40930 [Comamonadaceae bacterium]|nr:hypothetical protein [Comamonadaceae bacterium]
MTKAFLQEITWDSSGKVVSEGRRFAVQFNPETLKLTLNQPAGRRQQQRRFGHPVREPRDHQAVVRNVVRRQRPPAGRGRPQGRRTPAHPGDCGFHEDHADRQRPGCTLHAAGLPVPVGRSCSRA